jgi:hypothetical protein
MGVIRKDFKYKIIKNFLTQEEIDIAKKYFIMKHRVNFTEFDETQMATSTCDSYWYGDPFAESLLLTKLKKMQEECGLELNPTRRSSDLMANLYGWKRIKFKPRRCRNLFRM